MHEHVVLGEEPGEEHAMPVLVGDLDDEMLDAMLACLAVPRIPELPSAGA